MKNGKAPEEKTTMIAMIPSIKTMLWRIQKATRNGLHYQDPQASTNTNPDDIATPIFANSAEKQDITALWVTHKNAVFSMSEHQVNKPYFVITTCKAGQPVTKWL